mmetsp:Transcript_24423/g.41370  ORF Transcript_24423/g.41370 Transcript_24423/m.41370 type:complete len:1190 (-) Transcript_24423:209-3778(-)
MNKSRKTILSSRSGNLDFHDFDIKAAKDEEKRRHLLSKIEAIDKTLKDVRDTRGFKVSQSSLAPDVPRPLTPQDSREDGSYIINTTAPQLTTCPHCFKELTVRDLRAHLQKSCTQKMVQCPERGCSAVLPQNELKEHLKFGCVLAKKRRSLAAVSVKRKEDIQMETVRRIEAHQSKPDLPFQQKSYYTQANDEEADEVDKVSNNEDIVLTFKSKAPPIVEDVLVQCENCKDMVREDAIRHHISEECRYRKIYCSNRSLGCMVEVPMCELREHLKRSCAVEEQKDKLVQRSRKRREQMQCSGCGDLFELQYLSHHERTSCPNRKVPCRNHALGCQVIVRLKDRKAHEDVTSGVKPRPCLFFDGQDTRMMINEDDVTPPWTTELWVYRPSLLESCRSHMREIKRVGLNFHKSILAECHERVHVLELKASLETYAAQVGDPAGIEEITVKLAQQLLVYEKVALDTCMFGQLLLVAATTAVAEITEVLPTRPPKDFVDIMPKPTGKLCLKTYVVKGIDDGAGGSGKEDDDLSVEEAAEIAKKSLEINEQMEMLKKLLDEQSNADAGDGKDTSQTAESITGTEKHDGFNENENEEEKEKAESDEPSLPDGFDLMKTNTEVLDWAPKRWKDWMKMAEGVIQTLESDQVVLRSWRLEVGLVRMNDEELKALKKSKSIDDAKAKKEAAKAAKREKREKKKRKDGKNDRNKKISSNFAAKFEGIQRMYSGSEPISVGPDACIYLNLSAVSMPGKAKKKKGHESDSEEEERKGKQKVVKVQGSFGFADKIVGSHSFGVKIPREKWTHVIVKCTRKPKKRIFVYSNSILMGTLKDHYFNLPMESIGSKYLSLHGYLLDYRYWAKERSLAEIKYGMHNLLDLSPPADQNIPPKMKSKKKEPPKPRNIHFADMTSDQLISWWAFEDGFHNRSVQDISGNRFPTSIEGGKLHMNKNRKTHWYEAATLVDLNVQEQLDNQRKLLTDTTTGDSDDVKLSAPPPLVIPMPSYIERNLCPYEVKRAKLAQKGRALMKEAKCPLGCKEKIRKVDMRFHVKHQCERRKIKCRYKFCGKTYMAMDAWWHESTEDCAAIRARDEILRTAEIERKMFECDMCSEKIQSRHFIHHQENLCPHRLIKCPHEDCDKHLFPAHTLEYHLAVKCRSAAVKEKKILITRARATRSYARPWGVSIRFRDVMDDSDSEDD